MVPTVRWKRLRHTLHRLRIAYGSICIYGAPRTFDLGATVIVFMPSALPRVASKAARHGASPSPSSATGSDIADALAGSGTAIGGSCNDNQILRPLEGSPGADVAGASPGPGADLERRAQVPVQMWAG